jgi:hypothetical protein
MESHGGKMKLLSQDRYFNYSDSPIPLAAKAIRKEFEELSKELLERDRTGVNWSYKFKTFALPRSDKSLLDKGNYCLSRTVSSFSDRLDEQLQVLVQYPQLLS